MLPAVARGPHSLGSTLLFFSATEGSHNRRPLPLSPRSYV